MKMMNKVGALLLSAVLCIGMDSKDSTARKHMAECAD